MFHQSSAGLHQTLLQTRQRLAGLQLAIAGRGGAGAVILIDSKASDRERNALERIAGWILSLEGTPAIATLMVPINIQFGDTGLSASAAGGTIQITAHDPEFWNCGRKPLSP